MQALRWTRPRRAGDSERMNRTCFNVGWSAPFSLPPPPNVPYPWPCPLLLRRSTSPRPKPRGPWPGLSEQVSDANFDSAWGFAYRGTQQRPNFAPLVRLLARLRAGERISVAFLGESVTRGGGAFFPRLTNCLRATLQPVCPPVRAVISDRYRTVLPVTARGRVHWTVCLQALLASHSRRAGRASPSAPLATAGRASCSRGYIGASLGRWQADGDGVLAACKRSPRRIPPLPRQVTATVLYTPLPMQALCFSSLLQRSFPSERHRV